MNIFVGGSARESKKPFFTHVATEIGNFIVERKHNLVFGGCNCGLMGVTYRTVAKSSDSKIIATVAKAYAYDIEKIKCDEVYVSETVNERKNEILNHSDALIFLPGGIGTFDELLTSMEAVRNHQFVGPLVIINPENYYDGLLLQLINSFHENFSDLYDNYCYVTSNYEDAITYLKSHGF